METTVKMPETLEAGYAQVKNLIYHQVHKFKRTYGGDFDDLVGEANIAFVRGHNHYKAKLAKGTKDPYPTEIRRWVWYTLFDEMRQRVDRRRRIKITNATPEQENALPAHHVEDFDRDSFMRQLGMDARVVAGLVIGGVPEIDSVARAKGGTPRNYRSTVRTYLRGQGWSAERVSAAFEEITEALG